MADTVLTETLESGQPYDIQASWIRRIVKDSGIAGAINITLHGGSTIRIRDNDGQAMSRLTTAVEAIGLRHYPGPHGSDEVLPIRS